MVCNTIMVVDKTFYVLYDVVVLSDALNKWEAIPCPD